MPQIGPLHLVSAIAALVAGGWVLLRQKGTRNHRQVGYAYAASMLVLNVTALLIYRLTGSFGPFHVAALASLATLLAGIIPARRRLPAASWLDRHYFFMAWSYLGLVAAAIAETSTRAVAVYIFDGGPSRTFWLVVAGTTFLVVLAGGRVIRGRVAQTLRPFRERLGTAPEPAR